MLTKVAEFNKLLVSKLKSRGHKVIIKKNFKDPNSKCKYCGIDMSKDIRASKNILNLKRKV